MKWERSKSPRPVPLCGSCFRNCNTPRTLDYGTRSFGSRLASRAIRRRWRLCISFAVWMVIFRWSPFETVEKCLLLLSYFLFWEYFVISRNYALLALIGFAFVALQQHRPQQNVIPWLLLGLLANTHVLGAIWSIALGST